MGIARRHPIWQRLLGCAWGRDIVSNDDPDPCPEQAVVVIAVHPAAGDPRYVEVRLCAKHRDIVLAESTPTETPCEFCDESPVWIDGVKMP
jgi:hypothetical protein